MDKQNKWYGLWGIPLLIVLVGLDQWTKAVAVAHLKNSAGIDLISGVLRLEYLENRGAAFGIFQNQQWISLILAVVFLIAAIIFWMRMPTSRRMLPLRLITVVLAAGAIGNMIDRIIHHYVVDFIYFCLIDFPIFNVADIYVTCSCAFALILVFFYYKDEEFDFLFGKEKEMSHEPDGFYCRRRRERLDQFLTERIPDLSRSYLQKLIKNGCATVNEKTAKSSYKLVADDFVVIEIPDEVKPDIRPEPIPLDILYEDEDLLVVNKPKGMVVHPAAGHYSGTLVNALLYHCEGRLSGINGVLRPGIVHRIDRDTTGSLIVCKNDMAHHALAEQLKAHTLNRRYRAIVRGQISVDEGTVDAPIGRHPTDRKKMAVNRQNGKHAVTHYQVLQRFPSYTYVECRLETGRTHQIRVHMASQGHPLLGDAVYGPAKSSFHHLEGQCLHAMTLGFIHPRTGVYMECVAPLPEYFEKLLNKL